MVINSSGQTRKDSAPDGLIRYCLMYVRIDGTMAFDHKDYGMNSNIPFIKIANRVEVNVSRQWKRVSGPPPVFQQ